jgi:two-component system OmpR family sensor kinase
MRTPDRWTLRTRLVVAVVALTGVALVLANTAGVALLRGYLVDRLDKQLRVTTRVAATGMNADPIFKPLNDAPVGGWQEGVDPPPDGVEPPPVTRRVVARIVGDRGIYFFTAAGKLAGEFPANPGTGAKPDLGSYEELRRDEPYTVPGTDGSSWRVMAVDLPQGGGTVVMTASLAEIEAIQGWLLAIDAVVMAIVLLLLGLAAAAVVRLGMRPLTRMEQTAAQITAGYLGRRVPDSDPHTEPGRLGTAMNVMLDRVEREIAARAESEARMRRFLADVSHELRTPLTSVRGFAELYRRGGTPAGPQLDETMRRIEDEATRMSMLVNDMLTLAHLDEERPMDSRPVDLLAIAADTIRDARVRVPERQVRLAKLDSSLRPIMVVADEARLRQVAANLLTNALVHTPPDATVTVRVGTGTATTTPNHATTPTGSAAAPLTVAIGAKPPRFRRMGVLEVSDTGPGIPPACTPHIFERLYRASESRSRAAGGAGLGLAIVAAIVKALGGRVELTTAPGDGASFRVLIPLHDKALTDTPPQGAPATHTPAADPLAPGLLPDPPAPESRPESPPELDSDEARMDSEVSPR